MKTHELKTWPQFFKVCRTGEKPFEIRKNDRDFKVGDTLMLREWDPKFEAYSGEECKFEISYILAGGQFGIEDGFVVMGLI